MTGKTHLFSESICLTRDPVDGVVTSDTHADAVGDNQPQVRAIGYLFQVVADDCGLDTALKLATSAHRVETKHLLSPSLVVASIATH